MGSEMCIRDSLSEVKIGYGCWIGWGAIVLPGVTLGDGCVVGAGSVVTKSYEAGSVIAGNPARILKTRSGSDNIKKLVRDQSFYMKKVIKLNEGRARKNRNRYEIFD